LGSDQSPEIPPTPIAPAAPVSGIPWISHVPRAFAWAVCALVLYSIPMLLSRPLFETQEARLGVVAREMIERHDYLTPTLGGKTRLNKPPLPYWMTVVTSRVISSDPVPDERALTYAVLIPEALCAALAVFIVIFFGSAVFGPAAGTFAGLILGFSLLPVRFAELGYPDTALMLGCAGSLCSAAWLACAPRPGFFAALALGVSMAWAMLIKEPILALVIPAPVLIESAIAVWQKRFSARKIGLFALAGLIALSLLAPWYYLVSQQTYTIAGELQNGWQILVAERTHIWIAGHDHKPALFYFYTLAGGLAPWTPLILVGWLFRRRGAILAAAPDALPERQAQVARSVFRFMASAALLGFLGFLSQAKKQDYYLLPLLPALALASGYVLSCCRSVRGNLEEGIAWFHIALGLIGAAALNYIPERDPVAGHPVCFGLSIVCLLLYFAAARFWSERKLQHAAAMTGIAAFLAFLMLAPLLKAKGLRNLSIIENDIQRGGSLETEAPRLRAELDALGRETRVYSWGHPNPVMNFLLARPVGTQHDLMESIAKPDPAQPQVKRVVVATPFVLKRSGLEKFIPEGKNPPIITLVLPSDEELAKYLKSPQTVKEEEDDEN
jgi:4-amino-4-deoxy-L-arabinose transferase-like glycosyltransferase